MRTDISTRLPLVAVRPFIQATRDSGYKSTSAALAELLDNSFEANASCVRLEVSEQTKGGEKTVSVIDDGQGMSRATMQVALQFGGSTRFNSRERSGRYGMGLPNGSLSQARRIELFSWVKPQQIWSTYLDVDEVAEGHIDGVPEPVRFRPEPKDYPASACGTVVTLSKCDRLDYRSIRALMRRLEADFGRMFRHHIYSGKRILINGEAVLPFDPLFIASGANLTGSRPYGPPLTYEIACNISGKSSVSVRFSLLPIDKWHKLSNEDKNSLGISKNAGVSIVRAGREIDFGWYFMGTKRKENYDDWWRCEICFKPELDELFGVTHTKQKINPTEALSAILTPDLERVARELNAMVRKDYLDVKARESRPKSLAIAERRDDLMKPIGRGKRRGQNRSPGTLSGIGYQISEEGLDDVSFYQPSLTRNKIKLILNQDHTFYGKVYQPLSSSAPVPSSLMLEHLQLMLLSAARAECGLRSKVDRKVAEELRRTWSNALTAFLE
jgi:Histidine kinase-, DNA gyrase B-, and HSP90-like ATPase